jgi:uncharacterized membrane protein YheB (UPF0754 family)
MEWLSCVIGPLSGAIIGYITNHIAIRMLFRPSEAKFIGRFRVPFTPGIIPRRKDEIAVLLGRTVAEKFWGSSELEEVFTSDYLTEAFASSLADAVARGDISLSEGFSELGVDAQGEKTLALKEELCVRVLGGMLRHVPPAARMVMEPYLLKYGKTLVMPAIDEEFEELLSRSPKDLTAQLIGDKAELEKIFVRAYRSFMQKNVRRIVGTIDVGGMITEKIIEMKPEEVEGLVLDVVKKELRYIVWLGALLGLVIGTVNIFV